MNFQQVRVVLVETTHPGNIGACARAMKTMGLTQLVLVNPGGGFPCAEATARASGADDVLYAASIVADLTAALQGCRLVIGASARRRGIGCPEIDPRDCARRVLAQLRQSNDTAAPASVALVFGRENSGLSNDELDRCQFMVRIPANPAYSSLNLAAAVQVLGYELRMTAQTEIIDAAVRAAAQRWPLAAAEDQERFYDHLQTVLLEIGFLDPANPRHLMRRLRRLFNRARLEQAEVNILRGILTAVQKHRR